MKLDSSWFPLRILLGVAVCAVLTGPAFAERVSLDELTGQLATEITNANVKSVAVADFLASDGHNLDLGWYLAGKLSDDLFVKAKTFRVLDRSEMQDTKVSEGELALGDSLKRIGNMWGVETIVTGTVQISAEHYLVTASLRRTADGTMIATASQSLSHSRILDVLTPSGADAEAAKPMRAGVMGVGVPVCTYCPIPGYSEKASEARIQSATVLLMVIVSSKGTADKITVVKSPGYGFAEQAIEAVSEWKFRPAPGKDGAPVPVAVPVEVTFRSSRT